jgi:competence protein ComEA
LLVAALAAGVIWYRVDAGSGAGPASASVAGAAPGASAPARGTRSTGATGATASRSTAPTPTTATDAATPGPVVVDVAGDVARPGVVRLAGGARVIDAITAAGGARPDADLGRLNLAAKLVDGQHVAVPKVGEPVANPSGTPTADSTPTRDAPLDLNTATEAQLEALPGIGPSLAQAIVTERDRTGGFRSVSELRRVRGIGDARYAQLEPLVHV